MRLKNYLRDVESGEGNSRITDIEKTNVSRQDVDDH